METKEKFVCVRVLFHEALGHPSYDEPKKSESNRISTIMHHMLGWEAAGIQRCGKYGSARAWRRITDATAPKEGFIEVPEQMEIPFDK